LPIIFLAVLIIASNLTKGQAVLFTIIKLSYKHLRFKSTSAFAASSMIEKKDFITLTTDGPWVKMKQTLKESRGYHVSFLVPDELVNCH
jgi:hypothetical protein